MRYQRDTGKSYINGATHCILGDLMKKYIDEGNEL